MFEDLPSEIPNLRSALRVLSALIAPALLIFACTGLVGVTAGLLTAVIERTRNVSAMVGELGDSPDELAALLDDLERATRRSRLLQRALSSLLVAIVLLVVSSVLFGVVAIWLPRSAWVPLLLTVVGVSFLLYACVILALDSWVGVKAVDVEMDLMRRTHSERAKAVKGEPRYQQYRSRRHPFLPSSRKR